MQLLVDADACPVKEIIIQTAKQYHVPVHMVCDVAHILRSQQSHVQVTTVDKGADSADFFLANLAKKDDICVTADYGLATLFLTKGAIVLHPNGFRYTEQAIDSMLMQRHLSRKLRAQNHYRGGHIKKRTIQDDQKFQSLLVRILEQQTNKRSEHS